MKASAWLEDIYAAMNRPVTCRGSHNNEDAILRSLLPDDPVIYIDVGAAEPVQCSNTWQFYEAGGYGLLIEPLPEWWGSLLRHRPRDRLWPTAASDRNDKATFELFGSGSTLGDRGHVAPKSEWTTIGLMRFGDILNLFPAIRDACKFCNIDVEGHEIHVLAGIDWDTFRPDVFCIEDYDGGTHTEFLAEYGYTPHAERTIHNVFYTRDM